MLSRVANSVYWMSRYVERAENVARFLEVSQNISLGDGSFNQWSPLVAITGDEDNYERRYGPPDRDSVVRFLAFDGENPNSILSCISAARENARCVREVISSPMWEQLNKFHRIVREASADAFSLHRLRDFCEQVRLANHTLIGQTDSTISRDEAWYFANIGRYLERADKTSRIVDVQYFLLLPDLSTVGGSLDVVRWSALLKSASALEMYRRKHGRITPLNVADFLILSREFPRSIHFCLISAEESLRRITGKEFGVFDWRSEQLMGRLRADLDYARIDDVIASGMHEFIDGLQQKLNALGDAIHSDFFTHSMRREPSAPPRHRAD